MKIDYQYFSQLEIQIVVEARNLGEIHDICQNIIYIGWNCSLINPPYTKTYDLGTETRRDIFKFAQILQ